MFKIKFFLEWPLTDPNIRVTNPNIRVTDPNIRVNKQDIWMCDKKILIMKILSPKNDYMNYVFVFLFLNLKKEN